jgi:hypothetical protein
VRIVSTFFSARVVPDGSAKVVEAADLDRSVVLSSGSSFQVGFTFDEAQTGYTVPSSAQPLYLVLPAGLELYVYAGAISVNVLVSGSPG